MSSDLETTTILWCFPSCNNNFLHSIAIMSFKNIEPKSLLPSASKGPEIGSDFQPKIDDDDSYLEANHRRGNRKDCVFLILGLCLILSFVYPQWPLPTNFVAEVSQPTPLTVGQRVTKILTSTPLIGKNIARSYN